MEVKTNEGSFLQTPFWGRFKARHGWNLLRVQTGAAAKEKEVSVLVRSFARGLFSLAYVPMFPVFKAEETTAKDFVETLENTAAVIKSRLPKNTICIRFDPDLSFNTPSERDAFVEKASKEKNSRGRKAVIKNAVDIQPPDSTLVDLTKSEEEILAGMKGKWRYNINLARKRGVTIEKWPPFPGAAPKNSLNMSDFLDIFYELYRETSARDGIAMHAKAYYEDLLKSSAEETAAGLDVPKVSLYLARHEGDSLGAIMVLNSKTESVYLYGCSGNRKRNLMPNFLLQWTAMQDAKAYGSLYYDMYGMPPDDDERHPMHGLYLFKTGFGGKNIHRAGSWDVPLKKAYHLAAAAEKARAFWHKKVLKKIRGR